MHWPNDTTAVGSYSGSANRPGSANGLGSANGPSSANAPDSATQPLLSGGPPSPTNFLVLFTSLVVVVVFIGLGAKCIYSSSQYGQAKDDTLEFYNDTVYRESSQRYASPRDIWTPSARELGTEYRGSAQHDEAPQDLFAPRVREWEIVSSMSTVEKYVGNQQIPTEHQEIGHILQERQVSYSRINLPDDIGSGKLPDPLTYHVEC
jgi:hypothetical protein